MSEQESQTPARAPQGEQTYVVLMATTAKDYSDAQPQDYVAWREIATVTVPPRTKRSVVIKKALAEAGIKPVKGDQPKVRALDVDSAEVHEPKPRQPDPEWVL